MSAWTVIAHTEVGSGGAGSILFSSIPATYDDLVVVLSTRTSNTAIAEVINILFNGSSANITARLLYGIGSTVTSGTSTSNAAFTNGNDTTASTHGSAMIYFPNYKGSTNKSFSSDSVSENNATTAYQLILAGLWSQTAAITSLEFDPGSSANFAQYSSATLYGVTKGSSGGVTVS